MEGARQKEKAGVESKVQENVFALGKTIPALNP